MGFNARISTAKVASTMCVCVMLIAARGVKAQRAVIGPDVVKVYSLPMIDEKPIATVTKGDTVRVIGQRGQWVKIALSNGRRGWMPVEVRKSKAAPAKRKNPLMTSEITEVRSALRQENETARAPSLSRKPDLLNGAKRTPNEQTIYRRFGYSFGMGLIQLDYTYNWKFVFHSTPRLALEGSFKHALGEAADSYFIMANLSYLLKEHGKILPFVTGGMGVINTVPDRGIGSDSVSHMAINYGVGARKYLSPKLSVTGHATQFTTFVGKGIRHFREFTIGLLVGKFWD